MLPETCDDEQVSSCSFDLECKGENEKCCADACGIKQCKQIGNVQRENDGYYKCYYGVIMHQSFVTGGNGDLTRLKYQDLTYGGVSAMP